MFVEYDDVLIGRADELDYNNFFGNEPSEANQKVALSLIKYVIEDLLEWDKKTAIIKFDEYMINDMKLSKVVKLIEYPVEVPIGNPRYILSLIYPREIRINQQQLCEETFEKIINSKKKIQFPRDYFAGGVGFHRFCYCLKYLIENYKPFNSIDEIYEFFDSPAGKNFLKLYRLQTPIYQFNIDIKKAIKYITREYQDSQLYYSYYSFLKEFQNEK